MSVDTLSSIPGGIESLFGDQAQTPETKKEDSLGRDAFLKMLIAQMENQDPLNPMEGSDFSAQLAQFSSLEQLFNMNDHLETIGASLESKASENVLDYIGKQVKSEDSALRLIDGAVSGGLYTLEDPGEVVITILGELGQEVVKLFPGQMPAGTHQVDWNGLDRTGAQAPNGTYQFKLAAIDPSGLYEPVTVTATGLVTGVTYVEGIPYLEVDGRQIDPATVVKVWNPSDGT